MPEPGRRITATYHIAATLTLRVTGSPTFLMPFDAFYGPMRVDETTGETDRQLTVRECAPADLPKGHRFAQTYKGADWELAAEALDPHRMDIGIAAGMLGRVMVAQAGVGSLIRWMLGHAGFAWVHAAALVREDEALVLAGPSGVGKSQLVLRAIRDGWRYITDDHALLHDRGLTGITTPILLRGYGGWPSGLPYPLNLRGQRALARVGRLLTRGAIDPMFGYTPTEPQARVSPPPTLLQTTVCLLQPGETTAVRAVAPTLVADTMQQQMRHAGRFLDQLVSSASASGAAVFDLESFWRRQSAVLGAWLQRASTFTATLTQPVDDAAHRSLFALLGHGARAEGGGRG